MAGAAIHVGIVDHHSIPGGIAGSSLAQVAQVAQLADGGSQLGAANRHRLLLVEAIDTDDDDNGRLIEIGKQPPSGSS